MRDVEPSVRVSDAVEPPHEGAVAARLDDGGAVDQRRPLHAVMRVPAEEHVDAVDLARELDVLRKAEVRQHDDEVDGLLVPQPRDVAGQLVATERQAHARAEIRRHGLVDDGGRDADNSDAEAPALDDPRRREAELPIVPLVAVGRQHRIGQRRSQCLQLRRPISEVPVSRHAVEPEMAQDRQQGPAPARDDRQRAVERVAVVERQHGPAGLPAHLPEVARDAGVAAEVGVGRARRRPHQLGMQREVAVDVVDLQDREPPLAHGGQPQFAFGKASSGIFR